MYSVLSGSLIRSIITDPEHADFAHAVFIGAACFNRWISPRSASLFSPIHIQRSQSYSILCYVIKVIYHLLVITNNFSASTSWFVPFMCLGSKQQLSAALACWMTRCKFPTSVISAEICSFIDSCGFAGIFSGMASFLTTFFWTGRLQGYEFYNRVLFAWKI